MISTANFFWNGSFSLYEYACVASFVKNNFTVNVFSFDSNLNLPPGAKLRNARDIMPENQLYAYSLSGHKGSMAGFADAFRCNLLKQEGGWWFDIDVMCLRDVTAFRKLVESKPVAISVGHQNAKYLNNAVLYADDKFFVDALLNQLEKNGKDVVWGENGPRLTTKIMTELGYMGYAEPVATYYPFDGHDLVKIFKPDHLELCLTEFDKSLAMHLWNDVLRRVCIPKNMLPPAGSYACHMFETYCPELKHHPKLPIETTLALFDYLRLQDITGSKTVSTAIKAREAVRNVLKRIKI